MFLRQHSIYRELSAGYQGVRFFGNDTFGHWVMPGLLGETHLMQKITK